MARTKKFARELPEVTNTKQKPEAGVSSVHRGFEDAVDTYMTAEVGNNTVKEWIQYVYEEEVKTLWLLPYHTKAVELEKNDHVTSFPDSALITHDHHTQMFVSKKVVLYIRNIVWNAASVTQMC